MTSLSVEQANSLKQIVLHYLQGENLSVVKVRLQAKCSELGKSTKSLYKLINIRTTTVDPYTQAILGSLNIQPHPHPPAKGTYEKLLEKSDDLHTLLKHLHHDGHRHIGYLLQLIENTKPKTNWALIFTLGAIASAAVGSLLYIFRELVEAAGSWFIQKFPNFINWLSKPATLLRFTPLIGIIYHGLGLIWSLYKTFANGTTTTIDKLQKLFFKTLASGSTIAAYSLTYYSVGAMSVPIAILFVLGASVDVFQGAFNLLRSNQALKTLDVPKENAPWEVVAEYERAKNSHQHAQKSVWIKIGAALLITTAVAVWQFFPPNIVLTIVSMVFISLTGLAKRAILNSFSEKSANDLQGKLSGIETSLKPELNPANKNTVIRLALRQQRLEAKERALEAREQALMEREEIMLARTQEIKLSSPAQALALLTKENSTITIAAPALQSSKQQPHVSDVTLPANDDGDLAIEEGSSCIRP